MIDRRQSPRIVADSNAVVTVLSAPAAPALTGKTFFCKTGNISEGGILIFVSTAVPQGAELGLQLAFREPIRTFQITGRVAWTAPVMPNGTTPIGIEFLSGKGRDLESWQQTVSQKIRYCGAEDLSIEEGGDGEV